LNQPKSVDLYGQSIIVPDLSGSDCSGHV